MKFAAGDECIHTAVGEKIGSVICLRSKPGYGLHGPYVDLPAGPCVARIFFNGPTRGHAIADVLASGYLVHASRPVDLSTLDGRPLEITADLASRSLHARCGLTVRQMSMPIFPPSRLNFVSSLTRLSGLNCV